MSNLRAPRSSSSDTSPSSIRYTSNTGSDEEEDLDVTGALDSRDIPLQDLDHAGASGSQTGERQYEEEQDLEGSDFSDGNSDDDTHTLRQGQSTRRASIQSFELYTPDEERAVLRKLDSKLVLFVALLYLLSFLDRSNIGNAKVAGMKQDLSLSDGQYRTILQGFYVTYILFEWMTLLYRVVPPHVYVSICVASWGIVASLQAVSTGFASLLVLRLLLGVTEAAFGPGVPFYLSFFFKRNELAFRTGLFISAAPLASSFASSLAYAVVRFGSHTRIQSWRLLFLIEGFPSVLVAVWAWFWIPDSPATASWLKARERRIAVMRLRKHGSGRESEKGSATQSGQASMGKKRHGLDWSEIFKTLRDPKSYLTAAMFFSCNVAFSSMPVFEPVIVEAIGYSAVAAQGLTALPHLFAFVVVLCTALISDRLRVRSFPIVAVAFMAMTCYIFLALAKVIHLSQVLRYLCLFPITAGFFSAVTLVIVWTMDNQESNEGKGMGVVMINIIGQLGPLVGTSLYPEADGPFYVKGHSVCAGFMGLVAVLAIGLRWHLRRANSRNDGKPEYARLGDRGEGPVESRKSPDQRSRFVYML